jgi:hypothetical protein
MKPMQATAIAKEVAELRGCMNDVTEGLRAKMGSTRQEVVRDLRRVRGKAEDMLEEGRHEIKTHPVMAVSAFLLGGMALGFVAGVFFSRRR